ncbi:YciI family protein [Microbacterium elymi]|uniref:YciI family protein n=1 Tax=Microbacterium elymi TaxID=2909587 RepID=A0ABY5NM99_9MICO|nr:MULTISPECIES: YciI family protein [Microbacterium]UUT36176.1 YciI family protein [Microbacterium elymi]
MSTFIVTYHYADDSDARRTEHRPDHVAFLQGLRDAGVLYMSGPLTQEPPRAVLVLEDDDVPSLEARMDEDPFHRNGLIARREIEPWKVFFDPRRPADR